MAHSIQARAVTAHRLNGLNTADKRVSQHRWDARFRGPGPRPAGRLVRVPGLDRGRRSGACAIAHNHTSAAAAPDDWFHLAAGARSMIPLATMRSSGATSAGRSLSPGGQEATERGDNKTLVC
jgi:hypothetical protein